MRVGEINDMLHKTEELKALFVFGQRVIPFLEEIFLFIREVTPLLENINSSIEENLSKMPKASQQLSNVTRATELATTEILDTLDGLSYKADVISSNLKQLLQIQVQNKEQNARIVEAVNSLQKSEGQNTESKNSIYARVSDVIRRIESREGGASSSYHLDTIQTAVQSLQQPGGDQPVVSDELVAGSEKLLESIRMDSTQIMMSLQVQDITSQQLAAVNSLLQTVQGRLSEIMVHFRNTEIGELIATATRPPGGSYKSPHAMPDDTSTQVVTLHRAIAYDSDIDSALTNDPNRQDHVDSVMSGFYNGGDAKSSAGQDDIDALFNQSAPAGDDSAPASTASATSTASAEPSSQNDIDAMFGNSSSQAAAEPAEPSSQDDIDAMFATK
jgi:chemotaxis regulatin CheY-phosphate phosphatase CheZ